VHHGDGVQAIFYDDPRVLTVSLHETPVCLFPGTGFPTETGGPQARGSATSRTARYRGRGLAASLPRSYRRCRAYEPSILVTQHGATPTTTIRSRPRSECGRAACVALPGGEARFCEARVGLHRRRRLCLARRRATRRGRTCSPCCGRPWRRRPAAQAWRDEIGEGCAAAMSDGAATYTAEEGYSPEPDRPDHPRRGGRCSLSSGSSEL
jgi:acetoin utilization protein AcuC